MILTLEPTNIYMMSNSQWQLGGKFSVKSWQQNWLPCCAAPAEWTLQIQLEVEALLQLIWSSVTCWDMKPTLPSSSNLHKHTVPGHWHDRYKYKHSVQYPVWAHLHSAITLWYILNEATVPLSKKHTHADMDTRTHTPVNKHTPLTQV